MNYRSNSPGEGNGANSAPPSPVSQSLSPASSPGLAQSPASPFTDQTTNVNGHNQVTHSFLSIIQRLLELIFLLVINFEKCSRIMNFLLLTIFVNILFEMSM